MSDLVAFLRADLDRDEKLARRAAELCGCHPPAPSWIFGDESTDGRIVIVDDPHPAIRRKLSRKRWNGTYEGLFAAEHIVRHDPARVLAEVETIRGIIELYEDTLATIEMLKSHGRQARAHEVAAESYMAVLRLHASARGYRKE